MNIRSPAPLCYLRHPHNTSMPSLFFSAVSNILLAHSSTSSQTCVYH
ncbi:hypothetical protein BN1182_BF_00270 [Pantoea ananatis]|nr:hypothetical protein BN1182_BF_00270 [Pantoea ananatis]